MILHKQNTHDIMKLRGIIYEKDINKVSVFNKRC